MTLYSTIYSSNSQNSSVRALGPYRLQSTGNLPFGNMFSQHVPTIVVQHPQKIETVKQSDRDQLPNLNAPEEKLP